ncbi:zinc finger protein 862-like [Saccostrea cucullata]|uniref:zinc finger protein 862-like n=1 Tax=Saccostrea cuccullata TaxID=36930 RepID=UPI002ED29FDB
MPPKKIPRPEKGQTLLNFNKQNPNKSAENDADDVLEHADCDRRSEDELQHNDDVWCDNYRIKYQSYYTANELLDSLNFVADCEVNKKCRESPYMSILADESTDISNTRRMTITARVIDPKTLECSTILLQDLEYEDGTGVGLTQQITNQLCKRSLSISKVIGLGSDGASVMTGLGKGVYGRLKELNPLIINVHCMAHRLALCTSQAANSIPTLKKYQEFLTNLFYYFKQSAAREKELHKIQEFLDHPTLRYREIHAVRWMSFLEALQAVYRTIDPLITYLHNCIAAKDPKAKGLLKYTSSRTFLFITYLMMDVIPIVSRLCLAFQKEDLDIAKAKVL